MSFSKYPVPNAFMKALQEATPGRIGIGHAGGRYLTRSQLKFKEDLAVSKDAVYRDVPDELLRQLGVLVLQSNSQSRRNYLMDSHSGRNLDKKSCERLKKEGIATPDVQLILSDGLSSEAFENNVPDMLPLLQSRLKDEKLTVGSPVFENDGLRCCERCNELYRKRTERAESVLVTSKQPKKRKSAA